MVKAMTAAEWAALQPDDQIAKGVTGLPYACNYVRPQIYTVDGRQSHAPFNIVLRDAEGNKHSSPAEYHKNWTTDIAAAKADMALYDRLRLGVDFLETRIKEISGSTMRSPEHEVARIEAAAHLMRGGARSRLRDILLAARASADELTAADPESRAKAVVNAAWAEAFDADTRKWLMQMEDDLLTGGSGWRREMLQRQLPPGTSTDPRIPRLIAHVLAVSAAVRASVDACKAAERAYELINYPEETT